MCEEKTSPRVDMKNKMWVQDTWKIWLTHKSFIFLWSYLSIFSLFFSLNSQTRHKNCEIIYYHCDIEEKLPRQLHTRKISLIVKILCTTTEREILDCKILFPYILLCVGVKRMTRRGKKCCTICVKKNSYSFHFGELLQLIMKYCLFIIA